MTASKGTLQNRLNFCRISLSNGCSHRQTSRVWGETDLPEFGDALLGWRSSVHPQPMRGRR